MKTLYLITLLIFSVSVSLAYTWIPYGPDTIAVTNCRFGIAMGMDVICSPDGLFIYEDDMEWHYYPTSLPLRDAAYKSPTEILVAMGNGSYSDGIYTFNLETHQFEIAVWWFNPNFIHYAPILKKDQSKFVDQYFVGGQFSGMITSVDGINWTEMEFFSGKSCSAMDYYENHFVVTELSNIYNIYWSDDYGITWNISGSGSPMISAFKFNSTGELYGIFPDYSNSSGLYKSMDFGNTWELEFWSDNLGAVGFDVLNNIFIGWKSPTTQYEGIALYDPYAPPPNLTFLNEGLPNLNINKILLNPTMSAIAIFVCTDAGVFLSYDYMMGTNELKQSLRAEIIPNPVSGSARIYLPVDASGKACILNSQGVVVKEFSHEEYTSTHFQITWDRGLLPAGVYYLLIHSKFDRQIQKIILR